MWCNLSYINLYEFWVFTYQISTEVTNHVSEDHLLTIPNHIYIIEGESRLSLLLFIMHKYCQVRLHSKDLRYIHCLYLLKSEYTYQNYDILTNISMNQFTK